MPRYSPRDMALPCKEKALPPPKEAPSWPTVGVESGCAQLWLWTSNKDWCDWEVALQPMLQQWIRWTRLSSMLRRVNQLTTRLQPFCIDSNLGLHNPQTGLANLWTQETGVFPLRTRRLTPCLQPTTPFKGKTPWRGKIAVLPSPGRLLSTRACGRISTINRRSTLSCWCLNHYDFLSDNSLSLGNQSLFRLGIAAWRFLSVLLLETTLGQLVWWQLGEIGLWACLVHDWLSSTAKSNTHTFNRRPASPWRLHSLTGTRLA